MRISIALATFNGEKFLKRQLASLADQTLKPAELVVSDDGSSDQTLSILFNFAKTAPFPVNISQPRSRLGYQRNFIRTAKLCTSELIAFCDQDDIWEPKKLQIMRREFNDPDVLLAFHGAILINKAETKIGHVHAPRKNDIRYEPLEFPPGMIVPGFSQIFRRSLVRFNALHRLSADPHRPNHRMPHDLWYPFWASVLGRVVHVPAPLARYRQHDANTSGWIRDWSAAFFIDNVRNAAFYARCDAVAAGNRLDLLQKSRRFLAKEETDRIDAAIEYYRAQALRNDRRWAFYKTRTFMQRARMLASLVRSGDYARNRPESFGLQALLLDAFIGVPFARVYRTQ